MTTPTLDGRRFLTALYQDDWILAAKLLEQGIDFAALNRYFWDEQKAGINSLPGALGQGMASSIEAANDLYDNDRAHGAEQREGLNRYFGTLIDQLAKEAPGQIILPVSEIPQDSSKRGLYMEGVALLAVGLADGTVFPDQAEAVQRLMALGMTPEHINLMANEGVASECEIAVDAFGDAIREMTRMENAKTVATSIQHRKTADRPRKPKL